MSCSMALLPLLSALSDEHQLSRKSKSRDKTTDKITKLTMLTPDEKIIPIC
jgi:hypothetical protein